MRKQYWHQNICKAGRYFRRGESEGEAAYIARPARLPGPQQIRKLCEDRLALCLWCGVTFYPIGFLKNHDSLDCHETAGQVCIRPHLLLKASVDKYRARGNDEAYILEVITKKSESRAAKSRGQSWLSRPRVGYSHKGSRVQSQF